MISGIIGLKNESVLLVPTEDTLLCQIKLPKLSTRRLQAALPFALEESVADDIENLHFVAGTPDSEGNTPVIVIAKTKMQAFCDAAEAEGTLPTRLTPDIFALPVSENHWHAAIFAQRCLLRTGPFSGFGCDRENFAVLLLQALNESTVLPETIHLHFFTTDTTLDLPEPVPVPFNKIQHAPADFDTMARESLETRPAPNLMQGEWKRKDETEITKKIWKITGGLAVLLVLLTLGGNLVAKSMLTERIQQTDEKISTLYRHYFPAATSIVAPRERMLALLGGKSGKKSFLHLLVEAGTVLTHSPRTGLRQLEYHNGQMKMTLESDSFNQLDALIPLLQKNGLKVKQQNASTAGNLVRAEFLLSSLSRPWNPA